MKYCDIVHDLAVRGFNWRYYDENFRYLRQSDSASHPWGHLHWELWLRSQWVSGSDSARQIHNNVGRPFMQIPKGYCYKFHKGVIAPAVISSMIALSAMVSIKLWIVILFVPFVQIKTISQPPSHLQPAVSWTFNHYDQWVYPLHSSVSYLWFYWRFPSWIWRQKGFLLGR